MRKLTRLMTSLSGQEIEYQAACDPQHHMYLSLDSINGIPYALHRKVIDAHFRQLRCDEELIANKIENRSLFSLHLKIMTKIEKCFHQAKRCEVGVSSVLFKRLCQQEVLLKKLADVSTIVLSDDPLSYESKYLSSLPTASSAYDLDELLGYDMHDGMDGDNDEDEMDLDMDVDIAPLIS